MHRLRQRRYGNKIPRPKAVTSAAKSTTVIAHAFKTSFLRRPEESSFISLGRDPLNLARRRAGCRWDRAREDA